MIPKTSNNIMSILKEASAIITEQKGLYSHAAIVGLTREIPVICGAEGACSVITNGTTVTVDATRGIVYAGDNQSIIKVFLREPTYLLWSVLFYIYRLF